MLFSTMPFCNSIFLVKPPVDFIMIFKTQHNKTKQNKSYFQSLTVHQESGTLMHWFDFMWWKRRCHWWVLMNLPADRLWALLHSKWAHKKFKGQIKSPREQSLISQHSKTEGEASSQSIQQHWYWKLRDLSAFCPPKINSLLLYYSESVTEPHKSLPVSPQRSVSKERDDSQNCCKKWPHRL